MSMQQLASNQVSAEIPINRNFQTLEHQSVYGQRQSVHSGLVWGYYGGRWSGYSVADGTLTLTNAADNYVVVLRSTGAVSVSTATTDWNNTTLYARAYKLTTAGSVVTASEDHRAGLYGAHGYAVDPGGSNTVATDTIWDAAGDLAVGTGANTAARLAIGSALYVLRVNAGATALEWAAPAGAPDSDDVTYTPTTLADWDGSADPGDVEQALDQLAERITDVEAASVAVATDAIWDAKGDLAVGTGANTAAKLTAGSNDYVLMAASGETTGLKWATPAETATAVQGAGLDADAAGFRGIPQNAQSGNYTIVAADAGKHIYHASGDGAGDTYTIPANGSVAFEVGTALTFVNMDSNAVSIAITTDTMYLAGTGTTGTRTLAQYGVATAIKLTSTTWVISGTGLT